MTDRLTDKERRVIEAAKDTVSAADKQDQALDAQDWDSAKMYCAVGHGAFAQLRAAVRALEKEGE